MQSNEANLNEGINLTIHLDKSDAAILFLLAIDSGQPLEDVLLGMMEEITGDLELNETQLPRVRQAIEEYNRTGNFDPNKWRE